MVYVCADTQVQQSRRLEADPCSRAVHGPASVEHRCGHQLLLPPTAPQGELPAEPNQLRDWSFRGDESLFIINYNYALDYLRPVYNIAYRKCSVTLCCECLN